MINNPSLIIGSTGSGRTYNWLLEREKLKSFANSLIEKGEVHYVDLSEKDHKFSGLLSECNTYQNEDELALLLANIKRKFHERVELYSQGISLDELSFIHLVVYEKNRLNNHITHNLNELMSYILEKQRIVKIVIVFHDSTWNIEIGT